MVRRPAGLRAVLRFGAVACFHCSGWFGCAGWSCSAGACRRRVVPWRVKLLSVSCVRAWPHSMGRIQMCWCLVCWRALHRTWSTMVSWRPFPGPARSWRVLTVSLVQLSCRRYLPRGASRALPWRVAWRRSESLIVAGVTRGCSWSGGSGGTGCRGLAHLRRCVHGPGRAWLGWVVPGGLVGERRVVRGCHRCLWQGGLVVGVLRGRAGGVLEACGAEMGGRVRGVEQVSGPLGHAWDVNG